MYRYLSLDDLPGDEGTFSVCTFWLVQSLAAMGEIGRARELFERVTSYANDVGLFSEELDPVSGELLGNFPQAFTHVGLVNAAWAIAQAEGKAPNDLDAPPNVSSRVDTDTANAPLTSDGATSSRSAGRAFLSSFDPLTRSVRCM